MKVISDDVKIMTIGTLSVYTIRQNIGLIVFTYNYDQDNYIIIMIRMICVSLFSLKIMFISYNYDQDNYCLPLHYYNI